MTTIAYNHEDGYIAYDSRLTRGGTICTDDYEKCKKKDGISFVCSGVVSDCDSFIEHYPSFRDDFTYNCTGVLVKEKKAYGFCFNSSGEYEEFELSFNEAWGSGSDHALTAMDCGLMAKEAVEMAIKRDCGSGGRIREISVRA